MLEAASPSSIALATEQEVRAAYRKTSPKHRFRQQWKAGRWYERAALVAGPLILLVCAAYAATAGPWAAVYAIGFVGLFILTYGVVATEQRAFGQHLKAYGQFLNRRTGDPSRLRYLQFIDLVRSAGKVESVHLVRLIPAIEARINYRDYFFRRYPVLTVLSAVIVMLSTAGLAQSAVWKSSLGPQLLIIAVMLWLVALISGRRWRSIRQTPEAQERELLAFLHLAVLDLESDTSSPTVPA